MARKNRIVVDDGLYHVTAKVAHRETLLKDDATKSWLVSQMYGIADFAGIELYSWSVTDSKLHLLLKVPEVPRTYWDDPATLPLAAWRSMRPAECRAPRWSPKPSDPPCVITPGGDRPSEKALVLAEELGVPVATIPHHEVGFGMEDEEMLARLGRLYVYNPNNVDIIARRWKALRKKGKDAEVEMEKTKFCKRMYSVSSYMHTLCQRVSERFNRHGGHSGHVWDGRFRSTLVEDMSTAKLFAAAYVEWNAVKGNPGISHPKKWEWCSYSAARGDSPYAGRVRRGYEKLFGCGWKEAKARLEAVFADHLPNDFDEEYLAKVLIGDRHLRMAQLIKAVSLSRLAFFSPNLEFVAETYRKLGEHFPGQGERSVNFLRCFDWPGAPRIAA